MDKEYLRSFSVKRLIEEIEKTETAHFTGVSRDDFLTATDEVDLDVAALAERNRHHREQHASRRPGKGPEDARRRLQSVKMDTNISQDRARALILKRLQLRQEIGQEKAKLYVLLMKLEVVNAELEPTKDMLVALDKARDIHRSTGLYERSAAFVSRLYEESGVGWKDLDLLNDDQYQRVVTIIREPARLPNEQN